MKQKNRYVYVLNPGMIGGVAFVTGYEIDDLGAHGNSDLPAAQSVEAVRGTRNSPWTQTAVRLLEAGRRLVRQPLWRKALKPRVAA